MESDTLSDAPNCLATALVKNYEPKFVEVEETLKDLTERQELVMGQLLAQSNKLGEAVTHNQIFEMVRLTKAYQIKLVNLQKEMNDLTERTQRIKKQALKLQQSKQHEALSREQAKERESEREKQLIARPAKRC